MRLKTSYGPSRVPVASGTPAFYRPAALVRGLPASPSVAGAQICYRTVAPDARAVNAAMAAAAGFGVPSARRTP